MFVGFLIAHFRFGGSKVISLEIQAEILTRFFTEKQSVRQIAKVFALNRRSVRRIVQRRTLQDRRQNGQRKSILEPFKDEIKMMLEKNLRCSAPAVMNRLRAVGYTGGITVLQDHLRFLRRSILRPKEAFLRLEFAPGQAAQVDWGEFGNVFSDGVKIHCFAIVLCYSRYLYVEFTRSEKFEEFVRCHENAFQYFGGATKECWYDNLATAVSDRMGSLVRFNTRFMAYMGHHGIRPHACNVARGNEKGRVEGLIKYIRSNFWAGRSFTDFDDLQLQATSWRNQIANQREHRTTRRVVRIMFEADEQKALLPVNPNHYDTDEVFSRVVPPDFHLIYETNRYSVPWTLVGMTVTVRVNSDKIRIFYNDRIVTGHPRSYRKNKVFTIEVHRTGLLERKPGGTKEAWQLSAVKNIGPKMAEYVELLRSGHRSLRNELNRILALSTIYGDGAVYDACAELLKSGVIGVEALELTLKRLHHPSEAKLSPAPINFTNEKLNRAVPVVDLRRYDALLFDGESDISSASEKNGVSDDGRQSK
jgi:transposase